MATKKILSIFIALMLMGGSAFASFVNLTKPGTQWVWKVPVEDSQSMLLIEDEGALLSEDVKKLKIQSGNGESILMEDATTFARESITPHPESFDLGWALVEDGRTLHHENNDNLRMES